MSNDAIRLKSELVRTRQVIADKFRQSHDARTKRERELTDTFAPVTNSIAKMIGRRKTVNKARAARHQPNDVEMEVHNNVEAYIDNNNAEHDNYAQANAAIPEDVITADMPVFVDDIVGEDEWGDEGNAEEEECVDDVEMFDVSRRAMKRMRIHDVDDEFSSARKKTAVQKRCAKKKVAPTKREPKKRFKTSSDVTKIDKTHKKAPTVHDAATRRRIAQLYRENIERTKRVLQKKKDRMRSRDMAYQRNFDEAEVSPKPRKTKKRLTPKIVISPEDFEHESGIYRGVTALKRRKVEVEPYQIQRLEVAKPKKRKAVGKSLEKAFIPYNENIVYEYYDDPNELCERLQLLVSSQSAGNSNHDQEINSILEELRERNIIM